MRILDGLCYALSVIIVLLVATGGVHHESATMKLELSQVDAFAWVLLGLLAIRRWRSGKWLPPRLESFVSDVLSWFERAPINALAFAMLTYVFAYTWALSFRFDSFHANAYDMSFVEQ